MNALQTWAYQEIGATIDNPGNWPISCLQGPTVIPFKNMHGTYEGTPHHPALHGRYITVDLDANNRHSRDAWAERNPGRTLPSFGWGVCRHGFGLQNFPPLSEEEAERVAIELNAITPHAERAAFIGEKT